MSIDQPHYHCVFRESRRTFDDSVQTMQGFMSLDAMKDHCLALYLPHYKDIRHDSIFLSGNLGTDNRLGWNNMRNVYLKPDGQGQTIVIGVCTILDETDEDRKKQTEIAVSKDLKERCDGLGIILSISPEDGKCVARFDDFATAAQMAKKTLAEEHDDPIAAIMLLALDALEAFDPRRDPALHKRLLILYEAARQEQLDRRKKKEA